MAERGRRSGSSGEQPSEAPEYGEAIRHPSDHSWNLQILLDLKGAIERLDERTMNASNEVKLLREDFRGVPTRTNFWTGIGLIVVLLIGLGAAYWNAVDARIGALATQLQSVSATVQQLESSKHR
jgi:hypothetical protein